VKVTPLAQAAAGRRRLAVGTFDGVHVGHREVIAGADAVLTFDPHPTSVVAPGHEPRLLTTLARKAELVASLGVSELVVIGFDASFAAQSAEDFIADVLVGQLGAVSVSVGENFRFGHKAKGDTALLAQDTRFETRVVPLLEVDGEIVSSSHIRGLVAGGALEYAGTLLGAPFVMDGPVEHGDKRGRTLGYPTANLIPRDGYCTPGHGVYACRARTADGAWHRAAVNVGVRPMFESGRGELVEAFLVDFEGDIYGQELRIEFCKRLRGEKRFDSVDALVGQMARDVEQTRAIVAATA
jgi:riboflavin kinase/FMN adenylyltransferase